MRSAKLGSHPIIDSWRQMSLGNFNDQQLTLQLHKLRTLRPIPNKPISVLLKVSSFLLAGIEHQPGVHYRWAIMPEKAVGSQARRMRPLLPAPAAPRPPLQPAGPRPRQANVTVACRPCREKKAKVLGTLEESFKVPSIEAESGGSAPARGQHVVAVSCGTCSANTLPSPGR